MRTISRDHLAFAALVPALLITACDPYAGVDVATLSQPSAVASHVKSPEGAPLEPVLSDHQVKLLDTAFVVASKIPVDPHVKDRSRAQYEVVGACLKLNQPKLALERSEKINDWRRGLAFADAALYFAQKGEAQVAESHAQRAGAIAKTAVDWRRDRIHARIAQMHALLGDEQNAKSLETGADAGKADHARAMVAKDEDFDQQVQTLDVLIASRNFDAVRNAVASYAELFNRFYPDESRRATLERKIESALSTLPAAIRIETLLKLARFAIDHRDTVKASLLIDQAWAVIRSHSWLPEAELTARAHVAKVRWLAGEAEKSRSEVDEARAMYEAQRERIVDIERAAPLRAIAETLMTMGDAPTAMQMYRKAVEEGAVNPNSRPRALDLASTCVSMAVHRAEPDDEFWNRVDQLIAGLGHPW